MENNQKDSNRRDSIRDREELENQDYKEHLRELELDKAADGFCKCCGKRLMTWMVYPETRMEPAEYKSDYERKDGFCDSCGENWDDIRSRLGYPTAGVYDEMDGWLSLDVDTPNGEPVFIDTAEIMGLRPYNESTGIMIDDKFVPDGGHRVVK